MTILGFLVVTVIKVAMAAVIGSMGYLAIHCVYTWLRDSLDNWTDYSAE